MEYVTCFTELLPKNLRILRKSQRPRLTQEKLAGKIGLCRITYSQYERGRRGIPTRVLQCLAQYYQLPADDLLNRDFEKEGVERRRRRG